MEFRILSVTSFPRIFTVSSFKGFHVCVCAETSSSTYRSVASLVDALLARHAIFPLQREEPKECQKGRLIEVELLENIHPERKVAP